MCVRNHTGLKHISPCRTGAPTRRVPRCHRAEKLQGKEGKSYEVRQRHSSLRAADLDVVAKRLQRSLTHEALRAHAKAERGLRTTWRRCEVPYLFGY